MTRDEAITELRDLIELLETVQDDIAAHDVIHVSCVCPDPIDQQ